MSLLEQYRRGSFRGVEFDTFSFTRKKLKKYTEHQYANSERRYIEERGVQQPDFEVTMSIFGGDDYITKRNALRKALETEGVGLLVLPFEGEFNVKCVDPSDSQEIIENYGRCDFTATFKVVSENETTGNPIVVKNTKISLANRAISLKNTVASIVNKNFIVSNAVGYTRALTKLNTYIEKFTTLANNAGNGDFSSLCTNFASSIPSFIGGNVSILGSAISSLFNSLESAYDSSNVLLSSSETLFSYGDTDTSISPTTPERKEQLDNQRLLNLQVQVSAVAVASNAFANTDFTNEEDLKVAQDKLTAQIEKILNSDIMQDADIDGIADVKYYMKLLQVDLSDVEAEKEVTTPKLENITVNNESLALISYKYYDSMDSMDSLIELNNISNPKTVSGEIKVFTDV